MLEDIKEVINEHYIEEVIVAVETSEHNKLKQILDVLFDFSEEILIKVIPDTYDIMLGTVKMNHIYGCLLYTSPSPRDRTRSRMPSSA